ncbi:hypothetical protein FO519_009957, partial [Halicephalobus sp. NKZ332]
MLFFYIILLFFDFSLAECPPEAIIVPSVLQNKWSCLLFNPPGKKFLTAEDQCINKGGHLVSVPNQFLNFFIAQNADSTFGDENSGTKFWIGITSLLGGGWKNIDDGSNTTYFDWASGEPADSLGSNGCTSVDMEGLWYNDDCFNIYPYVCEVPEVNVDSTSQPITPPQSIVSRIDTSM